MELVFLTALGIGGATVAGALLGFVFKNISHRFSDLVLSFAAGVMLCAAIIGLILPSIAAAAECRVVDRRQAGADGNAGEIGTG